MNTLTPKPGSKKISASALQEILRLHKLWLKDHPNGVRANLRNADLRRATLTGAHLGGAIVAGLYSLGLINFSGGRIGRLSVYDAKNDIVHCGCFTGSLDKFEHSVTQEYTSKEAFAKISYELEIKKLRAFRDYYTQPA